MIFFSSRLKSDVEQRLLPKEEVIVEVELTRIQKKYYKAIYEKNVGSDPFCSVKSLSTLFPAAVLQGGRRGSSVISLRNVSMQLRKCCNHPYLLDGVEEEVLSAYAAESTATDSAANAATPRELTHEDLGRQLVASSGKMVLVDKVRGVFSCVVRFSAF